MDNLRDNFNNLPNNKYYQIEKIVLNPKRRVIPKWIWISGKRYEDLEKSSDIPIQ